MIGQHELIWFILFLAGIGFFSYGMYLHEKNKSTNEKNDRLIYIILGLVLSGVSLLLYAILRHFRRSGEIEDQSSLNYT